MMFHASIPATNPQQVAELIAKLWNGEAFRFPPWPGAWVAMAGDDRSTTVEVYPRDQAMAPGKEQKDGAWAKLEKPIDSYIPFHVAIATVLAEEEVIALAQEQGWRSLRCSRGTFFDVIEVWLDNCLLLEVMTPEMQAQYKSKVNYDMWLWTRETETAA